MIAAAVADSVVRWLLAWVVLSFACCGAWIAWHEVEYLRARLRVWWRRRGRRGWLDGRGRL